jgi:hypothetical protein
MRKWKRIVIHCTDSRYGNANIIRDWHVNGNGWSDIGYHYVILNGDIFQDFYLDSSDGSLEIGRPIDGDEIAEKIETGAHAYGYNSDSIGICLVGKEEFTYKQISKLIDVVSQLMARFKIDIDNVVGHYELDPKKTCPNFDMSAMRSIISKIKG